ncbi:MAG: SMC-Scp complex subunit ScpB [Candidatus Woesearchaeota archaeon]
MVKNTIKKLSKISKDDKSVKIHDKKKVHKKMPVKKILIEEKLPNISAIDKEMSLKEPEPIKSLKDMEEKILEKFEEIKTDIRSEPKDKSEQKENKDYAERVEAILFAVGKYLDEDTISQLCEIDKRNVKKSLEELKKDYDSRNTALMIIQEGNNWKINVREKYLSLVRKIVSDTELSKSIMETLAVVAWKTPVFQNEIVKIRGNKCYDHIEELVNAGFITKDKKGRSYVLKTTDKFYNYFDIEHKNLQSIMSEAKMPTNQTTLEDINKPEDTGYSREKLIQALETIETRKIVQTEEDKNAQEEFLTRIHQKIEDASKRTDEVISDIPKPMHQQEQQTAIAESDLESNKDMIVDKDEEEIVIDTGVANGEHHFQKPEEQPQKIKQLTKKQLEKKFKEELQRVKEKSEQQK